MCRDATVCLARVRGNHLHAGERFFTFVSASSSSIQSVARWGSNGSSFTIQNVNLDHTVLVGGKKEPNTGVSFFRNGAVGTSQAAFQFLIDGVRYVSLEDLW